MCINGDIFDGEPILGQIFLAPRNDFSYFILAGGIVKRLNIN